MMYPDLKEFAVGGTAVAIELTQFKILLNIKEETLVVY